MHALMRCEAFSSVKKDTACVRRIVGACESLILPWILSLSMLAVIGAAFPMCDFGFCHLHVVVGTVPICRRS